jgi:RNA polymerase sigma factor (sigma-70 family)
MYESTVSDNMSGQGGSQDLESFSDLVAKNVDAVYALAFAGLGDRESAEDLACDVFLRAWLNRNHPARTYPTSAWIAGLVRGLAREWAATGQIRSPLPGLLRLDPPAPSADETLGVQEKLAAGTARRQLERQIRLLTAPAREVVMLRLAAGQSNEDAAQLLQLSSSAVASLLKEAKTVLGTQPKVAGSPARLLGAADDLVRRILEILDAAEKSADTTRELLVKAASIDSLTKKRGKHAGSALGKGIMLLGGFIFYPFRLIFGSLYQVFGSRGTGLLLAMSLLAIMTLYLASLLGVLPAGMIPFAGPTPPPACCRCGRTCMAGCVTAGTWTGDPCWRRPRRKPRANWWPISPRITAF